MAQTQTKTQKQIKDQLSDLLLQADQIEEGLYPPEEVYEISIEGEAQGPFWAQDLKDYIEQNHDLCKEMEIRNFGNDEWAPVFSHPYFQRRRPQLVSDHSLNQSEDVIFVLREGMKVGPYDISEISQMVMDQKLLITEMVSIDEGHSWGPLYNMEEFDRRNLKAQDHLPHGPRGEVFLHSHQEVEQELKNHDRNNDQALANLAYIGNVKAVKARPPIPTEQAKPQTPIINTQKEEDNAELKWVFLFIACVIGLGALYFTWPEAKPVKTSKSTKLKAKPNVIVKKQAKRAPATHSLKNANKPKVLKPIIRQRNNISFKKSKAFRKAANKYKKKLSNKPVVNEDDQFYYDDASDPVELDPVRRKLSKETIDPEFVEDTENAYPAETSDTGELFDEEVEF